MEKLRFTGMIPPPDFWKQYPNWRNAFEEEGIDGQDETTLMPHEVQNFITENTSFTGGRVHLNDGREFPAFLAVFGNHIEGCHVFETALPWRIYYNRPKKKWVAYQAEWLPEAKRPPHVDFDNALVFPVKIILSVPWQKGGIPSVYQISSSGQMNQLT
jgi:hypothetical protein